MSLKLSLPNETLIVAVEAAGLLNAASYCVSAFRAAEVQPRIRYTVWRYEIEALAPSPNICNICGNREGDFFELEDPDDLLDMFPYGEWLDGNTFAVNQHPYCHCLVIRDHDVYW